VRRCSRMSCVAHRSLMDVESGDSGPYLHQLAALALTLGVPLHFFADGDPMNPPERRSQEQTTAEGIASSVCVRIRRLRLNRRWSAATLAQKCLMDPASLIRIELGQRRHIHLNDLIIIAMGLDISLAVLLGRPTTPEPEPGAARCRWPECDRDPSVGGLCVRDYERFKKMMGCSPSKKSDASVRTAERKWRAWHEK
jgi:DNA-binding Xre family transcriptional regulator